MTETVETILRKSALTVQRLSVKVEGFHTFIEGNLPSQHFKHSFAQRWNVDFLKMCFTRLSLILYIMYFCSNHIVGKREGEMEGLSQHSLALESLSHSVDCRSCSKQQLASVA